MKIRKAVKKALEVNGFMCRESWEFYGMSIKPCKNTLAFVPANKEKPPVPGWQPSPEDLTAKDWYVVTGLRL